MLQLKQRVAQEVGLGSVEKIRLLWRKKPVGDVKTLKEISGSEGGGRGLEFGVMVLGGVPEKSAEPVAPVAQGESGVQVLRTEVFWEDLRGFLEQRVRDRKVAAEASRLFREAWEKRC